MRITAFILLVCSLHVTAKSVSQTITLEGKNIPLKTVFEEIHKQTGFSVFYNESIVADAKPLSLSVKEVPLSDFLNKVISAAGLVYAIENKTIIVKAKLPADFSSRDISSEKLSPPIDVRGRVVDENGDPVAGAMVQVKETDHITFTSEDGDFIFSGIDEKAVLVISGVSIEEKSIDINGRRLITVKVNMKVTGLKEVVVNKGYYTERQKLSTGNVAKINAKELEIQPVRNPVLALQGRVAGLFISQDNGLAGGPVTIRIQGQNSLVNGNDPLIVVDGVPFPSRLPRTGNEIALLNPFSSAEPSPLSFINMSDVESIEVLKDADATAIYGSRAANGAILITTKKGRAGRIKINVNLQKGVGTVASRVKVLNRRQYLDMRYEAFHNDGLNWRDPSVSADDLKWWDTTHQTDWQDELIGGMAKYTNLQTAVSGGSQQVLFTVGATYQKETTVFPGDFADQRASVHFNTTAFSFDKKFSLDFSGNYMYDDNRLPGLDLTRISTTLEPVAPRLRNEDGLVNYALNESGSSTWDNPLIYTQYNKYENKTTNLLTNLTLKYSPFTFLELRTSFGYTRQDNEDFVGTPLAAIRPQDRPFSSRFSQFGERYSNSWIIEPQASYEQQVWQGKLAALVGGSFQDRVTDARSLFATGFISDEALKNIGAATTIYAGVPNYSHYQYNAVFGRLNYTWQERFVLNLTARRDGSSRFGANSKFHNFGSIGTAWLLTESKIVSGNLPWLSFAKLRASYGTTGSDQIADYAYLPLYSYTFSNLPYLNFPGIFVGSLANPDLEWEETKKLQVGFDLGLFNDRLSVSATYALNRSSNQLLSMNLPSITGFTIIAENFPATVENRTFEITASSVNVKSENLSWNTQLNLTFAKNRLAKFTNLSSSLYRNEFATDKPVDALRYYPLDGVDKNTGEYVFINAAGEQTGSPVFPDDYTIRESRFPTLYGGVTNQVRFKRLQLDILVQAVRQQNTEYNFNNGTSLAPGQFYAGSSNQPVTVLNRWQQSGDNASIQRYSTFLPAYLANGSNASINDASYIRIKNVAVSYQLPDSWVDKIKLRSAQLYVNAQNVLTITGYRGLDPEVPGNFSLPPLRVVTAGVRFEL